jgi:hypothetical protein
MATTAEFDRFIAIDWSGARAVRTPAIAVAEIMRDGDEVQLVAGPLNGRWSRQAVADWLVNVTRSARVHGHHTLVGIDANFSYAAEVIAEQIPNARHVSDLWAHIERLAGEAENFSGEAVWQHTEMTRFFWHSGPRHADFRIVQRLAEVVCGEAGHGYPESPFKLIGPKQVGKGGLAIMRLCHCLCETLGEAIAFWPYDPPENIARASLVLCEIYPRLFIRKAGLGSAKIRLSDHLDEALVAFGSHVAPMTELSDHDSDAIIAAAGMRQALRETGLPQPPADLADRIRLEGWIFGLAFQKEAS